MYINIIILAITFISVSAKAQTTSTFESISLATDSFWNGSNWSGGYANGNAYFVNHYDTSFGFASWNGFALSNKRDSLTIGYSNQYSAITAKGYNSSVNYAVAYGNGARIKLTGAAKGKQVSGFYITNSTYAFRDMKNGSAFTKKFGGATGNDKDWFKITISGFKNGGNPADTAIDFYLADFRFTDNTKDYMVRNWTWVDLTSLGNVDSIQFDFSSTDTAGGFGMNTPGYFCMDNFTTRDISTSVVAINQTQNLFQVYPNPAKDFIVIEGNDNLSSISIFDLSGKEMIKQIISNGTPISVASLPVGMYVIQINSASSTQIKKLIIE